MRLAAIQVVVAVWALCAGEPAARDAVPGAVHAAPVQQAAPAAPRSFESFRPSEHGFAFRNAFRGSPLPTSLGGLAGVGASVGAPQTFGLCGGMSSAAADLFLAGAAPPPVAEPPAQGTPIYEYLYSRQVASLGQGFAMVAKFAGWMRRPTDGPLGTRHLSLSEARAMVGALEQGRPVVIGLVLVKAGDGKPIWSNHQVLGYAARRGAGPRAGDIPEAIRIYDPNFPRNDGVELRLTRQVVGRVGGIGPMAPSVPVMGVRVTLHAPALNDRPERMIPVRGIFAMPYESAEPPRFEPGR